MAIETLFSLEVVEIDLKDLYTEHTHFQNSLRHDAAKFLVGQIFPGEYPVETLEDYAKNWIMNRLADLRIIRRNIRSANGREGQRLWRRMITEGWIFEDGVFYTPDRTAGFSNFGTAKDFFTKTD